MITTLHDTFVQGALGPQRRELTRGQAAPAGVLKVLKKGVRGQGAVLVEAWGCGAHLQVQGGSGSRKHKAMTSWKSL